MKYTGVLNGSMTLSWKTTSEQPAMLTPHNPVTFANRRFAELDAKRWAPDMLTRDIETRVEASIPTSESAAASSKRPSCAFRRRTPAYPYSDQTLTFRITKAAVVSAIRIP